MLKTIIAAEKIMKANNSLSNFLGLKTNSLQCLLQLLNLIICMKCAHLNKIKWKFPQQIWKYKRVCLSCFHKCDGQVVQPEGLQWNKEGRRETPKPPNFLLRDYYSEGLMCKQQLTLWYSLMNHHFLLLSMKNGACSDVLCSIWPNWIPQASSQRQPLTWAPHLRAATFSVP